MVGEGGERRICSCQALLLGTTWGPFPGKIEAATGGSDKVGSLIWYEGEFKMWTFNEFMKRGIGDTYYFPLIFHLPSLEAFLNAILMLATKMNRK